MHLVTHWKTKTLNMTAQNSKLKTQMIIILMSVLGNILINSKLLIV